MRWLLSVLQGFPLIFHGVLGKDEREANSPSFFNVTEVETLIGYLTKLKSTQGKKGIPKLSSKDIGIIAPYRKQVKCFSKPHVKKYFTENSQARDVLSTK